MTAPVDYHIWNPSRHCADSSTWTGQFSRTRVKLFGSLANADRESRSLERKHVVFTESGVQLTKKPRRGLSDMAALRRLTRLSVRH
jgi:hypothetical protein